MSMLRAYVAIARPDHWFKNIFMLPGVILAWFVVPTDAAYNRLASVALALVVTCLIASANYTINEWLDAEFDRHHPVKRNRPSAAGIISGRLVWLQWMVLSAIGLLLASALGWLFLLISGWLLVMGLLYNVVPFRTKDRIYLDVLSESINNPIRFLLGWAAVTRTSLPPSSILLAYWMGGAYLMAVKRYAEYRFIGDPPRAALYRRSFAHYTEDSLLLSAVFYAISSAFFLGIFLIKYRIEFLVAVPFLAALFVWYLKIGMRADSVTQNPERLYRERSFVAFVILLSVLLFVLAVVDMPALNVLTEFQRLH